MTTLSLTDFVAVVSRAGSPKQTKVTEIITRDEYHPATDFYKGIRDRIVETHKANKTRDAIIQGPLTMDTKKTDHYHAIAAGYHGWWGRKELEWFAPPKESLEYMGVTIGIRPELGLNINGVPHVIKLHFKDTSTTEPKLLKSQTDIINYLMATHCQDVPEGTQFAVLDVRKKKLMPHKPGKDFHRLINAELAYIAQWVI